MDNMKRYLKIVWENNDHDFPRIMPLDNTIENDDDLRDILQAKAKSKLISVTEFEPEPLYLILYVGVNIKRHGFKQTLILHLTKTCTEKYSCSLAMVKNFGKFTECEYIYDVIRCTLYEFIVKEEGQHTLYFEEFIANSKGEYISILQVLVGIFQCFAINIGDRERTKAAIQALTEVWEN